MLQQFSKRAIVMLIDLQHDIAVQPKIIFGNVRHFRRQKLHKVMADGVDGFIKNHRAIPLRRIFQDRQRSVMHRRHTSKLLRERSRAVILWLGFVQAGDHRQEFGFGDLLRRGSLRSQLLLPRWRMHGATLHRPWRTNRSGLAFLKQICHASSRNRFSRMRGVPRNSIDFHL